MACFFPRPFAPGRPAAQRRKRSPRPCPFTVLRTVDEYEQLVVAPRASAQAQNRTWAVSPLALVSLAVFFVLALGLLGLALFAGVGPLIK
jgi:hypothetical protein